MIYLQHGFLGTGGWYGDLAIALAEGTDSIVVLAIPLLTAVHRETVKLHKVVVVDCPTDIAGGVKASAVLVPPLLMVPDPLPVLVWKVPSPL